jgi:light-regulated signal transduction histidine kinase (bacteriophytochrome)
LIYKAIIETGIARPYTLLLRDLKQSEKDLARHAGELDKANQELSFANKELEAFNYSVSHDLRAPLRALDGYSQVLTEDYAEKLDDQGKAYLQSIQSSAKRMRTLIDDMLSLSRATHADIKPGPVNLSEIADTVAAGLQKSEPERRVEFNIAKGLVTEADSGLMKLALENLLGNAWKYTGKRDSPRIEFGSFHQSGKTTYYVRDNGVGFDMAYAGKLFNAFQRLHAESEFPGTGIGLATVHRIIERHGGSVWAESQPGKGAAFYFTLG